jgi:hypothetical protein
VPLFAFLMVSCWTLALLGGNGIIPEVSASDAFIAGAVGFMAFFAGISRWVAEPAARKVLLEHTKDLAAHPIFVTRSEWMEGHRAITDQITNLRLDLRGLIVELRAGHKVTANETESGDHG